MTNTDPFLKGMLDTLEQQGKAQWPTANDVWSTVAADKPCPCGGTKCTNWKVEPPWNAKICQFTSLPAVGTDGAGWSQPVSAKQPTSGATFGGWEALPEPSPVEGLAGIHNRAHDTEGEVRWPDDVVEQHNRGTLVMPHFVFSCEACEAEHDKGATSFSYGITCLERDGWLFRWLRSKAGYATWCPLCKTRAILPL